MNPILNNISKQPNVNDFKTRLAQMDNSFLGRMEEEARKRGISEADIKRGLMFIEQLKR